MQGLRRSWLIGPLAAFALAAFAPAAVAKTYFPNRHGDHTPNGCSLKPHKDCTLREAVISANHRSGSDVIVLQPGKAYKLSRTPSLFDETDGDLDVSDSSFHGLTIKSSNHRKATIDAQHIDRVINQITPLKIKYLRLRHGDASTYGGGIYAGAFKLVVYRSLISGNRAAIDGGGIEGGTNAGMTISQSTIHGNRAAGYGAGIDNPAAPLTILRSTVDNNVANQNAGGLSHSANGITAKIVNSTFANNAAKISAGGILNINNAKISMNATTVVRNLADSDNNGSGYGGGISQGSGPFYLQNSLIALNSDNGAGAGDCYAATQFNSLGHNLVHHTNSSCMGLASSDYVDSEVKRLGLGFLASNGGPTKTISISKRSTARSRANGSAPSRDQRGHHRSNPDIGAFEY